MVQVNKFVNPLYFQFTKQYGSLACWLVSIVSSNILPQLVGAKTIVAIWSAITKLYFTLSTTKITNLHCRLRSMKKGTQSIQHYILAIKGTCDLLATCGSPIADVEHITTILNGLPTEYQPSVAAITTSKDHHFVDSVISILIDVESKMKDTSRFPAGINLLASTTIKLYGIFLLSAITKLYFTLSTTKIMNLHCHLRSMKKGTQSMQDYILAIKGTCDLLATCGSPIADVEHITTILNGLPTEYEPSVAVITTSKDHHFVDSVISILIDAESKMKDTSRFLAGINFTRFNNNQVVDSSNSRDRSQEDKPRVNSNNVNRFKWRPWYQFQLCGKLWHLVDRSCIDLIKILREFLGSPLHICLNHMSTIILVFMLHLKACIVPL
ncbi:hypothetical protein GQ457_06G009700 [Hibiscus cannabinus]